MKLPFNFGATAAQSLTAVAACLGMVCAGAVLGYTSSALPSMQNSTITSHMAFEVTDMDGDWIGGLLPLGALGGSLLGGPIMAVVGRKKTMVLIIAPIFTIGWILVSASVHIAMMFVGRFLGGFAVGLSITSSPMMVVETAQVSLRGYLGAMPQIMVTIGILLSYSLGAGLDWVWLGWASLIMVVPYVLLLLLVPESPVWLLTHRGQQEALEALTWLRGGNEEVANQELMAIQEGMNEAKGSSDGNAAQLLRQLPYFKAFMVVIGLMLFQQLSGVNAVIFYTVIIFKETNSGIDPNVATILIGIIQVLATVAGTALIERAGRRPLLTASSLFMAVSAAMMGGFFFMKDHNGDGSQGWLPLLSMAVYIIAFSIGYGPLAWLCGVELLPFEIMSIVNPVATAINWGCVFLVTFTFKSLQAAITTYGAFWLFAAVAAVGVPFSFFCVPETKGLTPDEIRSLFRGSNSKKNASYNGDLEKY